MTSGNGQALLRTGAITKSFGGMRALSGIDLSVERGECLAIIGPNGAGKTTLFNVLTGLLRPSSGSVTFDGVDITDCPPYRRAQLGMARTMQITSVFPESTVIENILIGVQSLRAPWRFMGRSGARSGQMRRDAEHLLELVGLQDMAEERCGTLAYGDQRLVEIALALSGGARLVLLDEPTAGMSPKETEDITGRLRGIWSEQGITLVIVEHDMDVVMNLASRIAVLHLGKCIAVGAPQAIMDDENVNRIYLRGEDSAEA